MSIFTPFDFTESQKWGLIDCYNESTRFDREANAARIAENNAKPEADRLAESALGLATIPTITQFFKAFVTNHVQSMADKVEAKADAQSIEVGRMLRQHHPQMLDQLKTQMGVPDIIPTESQPLIEQLS